MKITVESTPEVGDLDGIPVRRWRGRSEGGVEVECLVALLRVRRDAEIGDEFEDLREMTVRDIRQLFGLEAVIVAPRKDPAGD